MRQRLAALDSTRQVGLAVVVALLVGLVTVAIPVLNSAGLILACIALLAALAVVVQWLWQSRGTTDWTHTFQAPPQTRGADIRLSRIAGDVGAAADGDAPAAARLHATLTSLAADRLRLRRGISWADDPDAAHAVLGPDLTAYLTRPPARLTRDRLETFTTTLEEI